MPQSPTDRAEALIEALPYIQKFRGQNFVIKYGGSAMEDDQVVERCLRDVVFIAAVGIQPILVHGGGKAITQRMRDAGLKPRFVNGLRVTDEQTIGKFHFLGTTLLDGDFAQQIPYATLFQDEEFYRAQPAPARPLDRTVVRRKGRSA